MEAMSLVSSNKNYSIYCLQDTHFSVKELNYVRPQWRYDVHMSPGTSETRGVTILLDNNFEYSLQRESIHEDGNLIELNIKVQKRYTVAKCVKFIASLACASRQVSGSGDRCSDLQSQDLVCRKGAQTLA